MRQIKFRAWDGKLMYSPIISDGRIYRNAIDYDDCNHAPNDILMQYTGLNDNNGMEIYDGDILSGEENESVEGYTNKITCICVVKWSDVYGKWIVEDIPSGEIFYLYDYSLAQEVIGNIHQNPELLGVAK